MDRSNSYLWETSKIRLRAVRSEDWETHWHWNQDSAGSQAMDRLYFPETETHAKQWAETEHEHASQSADSGKEFGFEIETLDKTLVGRISTHHCDLRCGTFSYGLFVAREHRQKGYASEAIRLVLRYYFGELRYQKVTVYVYDFNEASLRLHARLGFQQEGRLRRMVYTDGKHFDTIVFGLTAEEFYSL